MMAPNYLSEEEFSSLNNDNDELISLLAAIVKTSKEKE